MDRVDAQAPSPAADAVTALYAEHALGLVRLAVIMLGDQGTAEDVVHDAFLGLYRRWDSLADASAALAYVRSSVLNGCRSVLRHQARRRGVLSLGAGADAGAGAGAGAGAASFAEPPPLESAEALALLGEEHREVLAAIRRLPDRQREAVVLRYYLDMTEEQAARAMGVSRGTVKSATSRGVAAVGRILREGS